MREAKLECNRTRTNERFLQRMISNEEESD